VTRALWHSRWIRGLLVPAAASLVLLLPVLLQERVQAGDLASHLYNTWLVLLVKSGEPLGLEIVPQYSNVLFDWWLEGLWRAGGPVFAEKAAVSLAVLLFFWGAFFLISRMTGRSAWPSAPLLAMVAYGWIYHQGFFNYYLSCAFGFWAMGFVMSGKRWWPLAATAFGMAVLAHLLGAAIAGGLSLYAVAWSRIAERRRRLLLGVGIGCLGALSLLLKAGFPCSWSGYRFMHLLGATPFVPFGVKYTLVALAVFWILPFHGLCAALREGRKAFATSAADLLALTLVAVAVLPSSLDWPGTNYSLNFLDWRLAQWLPPLFIGWRASLIKRLLPDRYGVMVAALYFGFLAADYQVLGRVEQAFHEAVRRLPAKSRVVSGATGLPMGRNPVNHMISRACIGHCFDYGNYEPASAQFRIRALAGSPVVMDSMNRVREFQAGRYVVRDGDLPLYGVSWNEGKQFPLEARPLRSGERIVRQVRQVPPDWF